MDTMETSAGFTAAKPAGILTKLESLLASRPVILQLLKFSAIGVINAALDFLILNFLTKTFNITIGTNLGLINVVSFSVAVVQSYTWNKAWAFGDKDTSPIRNFIRLCAIGGLGAIAVILVIVGASLSAKALYYLLLLATFIVAEIAVWKFFSLSANFSERNQKQFVSFIVISIGGLIINSIAVAVISSQLSGRSSLLENNDLVKNIAKVAATLVSLVWNFVGYKIIVFKK